jgi:glucosamine-phosphate N-acetyltransferase
MCPAHSTLNPLGLITESLLTRFCFCGRRPTLESREPIVTHTVQYTRMEHSLAPAAADAGAGVEADGDAYRIRPLELADLSKGFCDLLAQLSPSPPFTEDVFRARFDELAALGADHLVLVAEDASTGLLAGAAAVLVERKFIRRCGLVGHVKDVVVDASARGRGLGERLVEHARERGCYKVIHTRLHSGAEGILRQMRIRGEERPDGTLLLI